MKVIDKQDKQKEKLKKMLTDERKKVKGYEEIAKLHSSYISILLRRLNATQENPVTISAEDVKVAMNQFETRAFTTEAGVWNLYCKEINE